MWIGYVTRNRTVINQLAFLYGRVQRKGIAQVLKTCTARWWDFEIPLFRMSRKTEKIAALNKNRQAFLMTFFNKPDKYEEKEVNGFILIKQFNGDTQVWQVAIYTKEAFKKRQDYNNESVAKW